MHNDIATKHLHFHDTAHAMVAMEVDWPDGASTGWHRHPRVQLLYAIEGVMVVRSHTAAWVVPPNRALWLAAELEHEVKMSGDVKMRTLFINDKTFEGLPTRTCVLSASNLLRELILTAVSLPRDYSKDTRPDLIMRLISAELRMSDELPLHLPLPKDERVSAICEHLINHPDNTSTVADWAEKLQVTSKTIHRLFWKETSMTFAQWREQARLLYALRRIACGEKIIDIAYDCGYGSPSAFTAMFRRHFGAPPSTFYS